MRAPSLKFLKTFQIAATKQSFKVAAEELFVTPSAVSHQIKTLEDQLGIELFDRGPHSLSLTEAGSSYLREIELVFSRLEAATEQLRERFGRGVVRLHIPPFFASELLVPRLQTFAAERMVADIHINTVDAPLQSHPYDADLSIVVGAAPEQGLACHRLFEQSFVAACAPELRKTLRNYEDLNNHVLLVHDARRDAWDRWAEACGLARLQPRQLIRFDTMNETAHAAEQGVGVALLSPRLSAQRFLANKLVRAFDCELSTGESYFLIHRHEDAGRSDVATLKRWLLKEFGQFE
jgi:LysR family transcriptional regulator, glycine cleavage system transcriptional activator